MQCDLRWSLQSGTSVSGLGRKHSVPQFMRKKTDALAKNNLCAQKAQVGWLPLEKKFEFRKWNHFQSIFVVLFCSVLFCLFPKPLVKLSLLGNFNTAQAELWRSKSSTLRARLAED